MTTTTTLDGTTLTVAIEGRIDTQTAPELDEELQKTLEGVKDLILDFTEVSYISSAGLRAVIGAQNKMDAAGGTMVLRGCNKNILGVFKVTGFDTFLTFE